MENDKAGEPGYAGRAWAGHSGDTGCLGGAGAGSELMEWVAAEGLGARERGRGCWRRDAKRARRVAAKKP